MAMAAMSPAPRRRGANPQPARAPDPDTVVEALGIVVVSPLFAHFAGPSMSGSLVMLTALSVA